MQFSFPKGGGGGEGGAYMHLFERDARLRSNVNTPENRITQDSTPPPKKKLNNGS